MKKLALTIAVATAALLHAGPALAQSSPYDPSPEHPYGLANPAQTDPEARVFDRLIGAHDCTHVQFDPATHARTEMSSTWTWYYDMNGFGIRDVYRYGRAAPASQRVFDPAAKQWHVWYFLGQRNFYVGEWVGGGQGDRIVLEQTTEENGRPSISRLQFFEIADNSFEWSSTNIDVETREEFVDWRISCHRRTSP